ncbi:MAG: 50S ribosomal protein L21 [Candidatus Campbellbacteria bacterium]|nr:50S ribosomal protein L21 [Candidatus Campbellbacteria bacterium]
MKLAVIESGGKQYTVQEGDTISIEKLDGVSEGDSVNFDNVLLIADGDKVSLGNPLVKDKKVSGVLKENKKGEKLHVRQFRSKSRYHRTYGHRQPLATVEIQKI